MVNDRGVRSGKTLVDLWESLTSSPAVSASSQLLENALEQFPGGESARTFPSPAAALSCRELVGVSPEDVKPPPQLWQFSLLL